MLRFTLLVGAFLLSFIAANAQDLSIKGVLQDRSDKIPLQGATLRLALKSDTLTKFNAVSDRTGAFEFRNLSPNLIY